MPKQTIKTLVNGGKATAGPPLGPQLGPLGINIGQVVADINKKTEAFKGMQVPVTLDVAEDKSYTISVGTPPCSSLILKEAGVEKGAANPLQDKVADLKIENIIKIAKMKEDALLGITLKEKVKEVIGTCNSMGIMVEGVAAVDAIKLVNEGKFDIEIKEEKTELSAEELKELEEEKKKLAKEMEERREEFIKTAKEIIAGMAGQPRGTIKGKLTTEKIPVAIIDELLPVEGVPAEGEKPEEGKEEAKEEGAKEEKEEPKKEEKKGKGKEEKKEKK